jgi:hypothetical protein
MVMASKRVLVRELHFGQHIARKEFALAPSCRLAILSDCGKFQVSIRKFG